MTPTGSEHLSSLFPPLFPQLLCVLVRDRGVWRRRQDAPTFSGTSPSFVVIALFDVASGVSGIVVWEEILARSQGRSGRRFSLHVCRIWVDLVTAPVHV